MVLIDNLKMIFFFVFQQDLRAMMLIFSVQPPKQLNPLLVESLQYILQACREHQQQRAEIIAAQRKRSGSDHSQEEDIDPETTSMKHTGNKHYNLLLNHVIVSQTSIVAFNTMETLK